VNVYVGFETVDTAGRVLVIAFSPVMVFGAFGTFLLILAESGGVPEAEAF